MTQNADTLAAMRDGIQWFAWYLHNRDISDTVRAAYGPDADTGYLDEKASTFDRRGALAWFCQLDSKNQRRLGFVDWKNLSRQIQERWRSLDDSPR